MSEPLAKRFYKTASASAEHGVLLDARTLRTPGGAVFAAPTPALAEAVAAEWGAQGDRIIPARMPLTQLAFAAIDHAPRRREELARSLSKYIETDLVSHRADAPAALVARQAAAWDPIVAWANARFGLCTPVVVGVIAAPVSAENLAVLEREIGALDDFRLTALAQAVSLAGSVLIGFALLEGRLSAEQAFSAAALDDLWSQENWGEDGEARARLDRQRAEFDNVARFIAMVGSP